MIDKDLAKLIYENPKEMQLFVELLCDSIVNTREVITTEVNETLDMYEMSGLISQEKNGAATKIRFKEDNQWIMAAPPVDRRKRKEPEVYYPSQLNELGLALGMPIDYHTAPTKYLKNFNLLVKKYSKETIEQVKEFVMKHNPKIDLNMFLTQKVFVNLHHSMMTYKPQESLDRVSKADYSEEQAF